MWKLLAVTASIALLLSGCGREPTVDAKGTDEEQQASIERVKESLPEDQHDDFEEAMKTLLFADIESLRDLADGDGLVRRMQDRIDGKTGSEIIAEAGQVAAEREERRLREEAERKERERQQAIQEIEEIAAKLNPTAEELCAKFIVRRSLFRQGSGGLMGRSGAIDLVVSNETGRPVSRAYFHALLLTPGRAVPWVDDEFNYSIPGGLEPGETAEWSLRPNMFGSWSNLDEERSDAVLIIRTVGLDGSDGESMTGARLSDYERNRLTSLLESVDFDGASRITAALRSREDMLEKWKDAAMRRGALDEIVFLEQRYASFADEQKRIEADRSRADRERAGFIVERSRFYWQDGILGDEPVIDVTLRNDTSRSIGRFYATGVLSSPGREKPWLEESFNYSIRGGMEPGETQQFKLAPNRYSEWGKAPQDQPDMVFTVSIERLDDAGGNRLFEPEDEATIEWTDQDAERLEALRTVAKEQGWE